MKGEITSGKLQGPFEVDFDKLGNPDSIKVNGREIAQHCKKMKITITTDVDRACAGKKAEIEFEWE